MAAVSPVLFILMAIKLLLIGDERKNRRMYAWGFASEPYRVKLASTLPAVEALLQAETFQGACIDLKMQDDDATAIVQRVHERLPKLPIVALLPERSRKLPTSLRDQGVRAQLASPFPIEELHEAVRTHALPEPIGLVKPVKETPPAVTQSAAAAVPRLMANDEIA